MEKLIQMLNKEIEDETAAFAILGAMIITFAITIITFEYIGYYKLAEVNANINMAHVETGQKISNIEAQNITNETITNSIIDVADTQKKNEEEFEKLKKEKKISEAADKYYIKVNYGAQVVTVYTKDSNGKYTKPVKAMVCSTGTYTPTSGTYRTLGKGNWWPLMGDVYGQYSTHITGNILFHSVPYLESGNKSSLEWWAYDQLGKRVSMGCVRLTVADAKWLYNNCPVGTQVEFYSSSNPGPLGKPTTKKISSAPSYVKGWDPTDPDSRNPWPKYLKELEKKKEEQKENMTNTVDKNNSSSNTNTTTDQNKTNSNTTTNTTVGENEINSNTTTNTTVGENEINSNITTNTTVNNVKDDSKASTTDVITTNSEKII